MAAIDLTTIDAVRRHLQKQSADVNQDPKIQELITSWSRAIMRYTRREFAPAVTATARDFEYDRCGLLDLAPYDLRTVTTVQELDNSSSVLRTLAATDYRKWPVPNPDGVYKALRITGVTYYVNGWPSLLRVTGDWGFSSVPEDVAEICAEAVTLTMRGDVQAFGSTFQPNSLGDEVNVAKLLPPGMRARLASWRR